MPELFCRDNFLIFYEGHGNWDAGTQDGCWLFSDAKRNNKPDWFRNSKLRDYIKEIKSNHTLLVSDACFDGLAFESYPISADPPVPVEKLNGLVSRKAITSGIRIVVPKNSEFAGNLINGLKKNRQKYFPARKLYSNFVETEKGEGRKVPQYGVISSSGDEGGDFIFVLK